MKRLYFVAFVIGLLFILYSCSVSDDSVNFHYEPLEIVSVDVPESFDLHRIYTIKVNMIRPDDCTLIEGFDVTSTDTTTRNVIAVGAVLEKTNCITVNQEVQDTFQFEVRYTQPYLFRFFTGEDANGEAQYIEVEVPVN